MLNSIDLEHEAQKSLKRILPSLKERLGDAIHDDAQDWQVFTQRLHRNFKKLFELYYELYHRRYDFFYHLEDLLVCIAHAWLERSNELRKLDNKREKNPNWFQHHQMTGGVCYVDLFAENIDGIKASIPYFKEIGLTYLHLMPLFKVPDRENDGGYAVSDYREVHPPLGTMKQLEELAGELRKAGISLVLDFVFNHTSDEHAWAKRAKDGDEEYMDFYRIFPDRILPDLYEQNLREIFPDEHPGSFIFQPEMNKWVWATFHTYQWDLNYENPAVFNHMVEEILFLANQGVEILRLDAVAFIWKELGTNCENLPKAHTLIKAFNSVARIAAPSLLFKSEAIVHPDDVVRYIAPDECQLSYNPLLMALLWNSLATRKVRLLSKALRERFQIHPDTAWVNYVRCHDDIGWTFSDEDASFLGINAKDHRYFLNEFYRGRFPGSFARGLPFQENPKTGDCRISGTCASLAGLEKALKEEGTEQVELAIRRILLLHGMIMIAGGIPLIYLGDEIGTLNDYGYLDDPAHKQDSRWVHRPRTDRETYNQRKNINTVEGRIFHGFQKLVELRKKHDLFSGGRLEVIHTDNDHVLGFTRRNRTGQAVVLANFSESAQTVHASQLTGHVLRTPTKLHGASHFNLGEDLVLEPLDFLVLG